MKKRQPRRQTRSTDRPSPFRARQTLRLAEHIRPQTIDLHFELDPTRPDFRGEARYRLQLDRACRQIELHSVELDVASVCARVGSSHESIEGRVEAHPECETIVLRFGRRLPAGEIQLELRFRGRVRNDLRGLYRSTDRERPWLASQLCPTDARRFFPCFDEPGTKARYAIRVTAPARETVLSNAPIAKRSKPRADGRRTTEFEWTPPLSAYLVAVAVGPFVASRPVKSGDTAIRVYTLPGGQPLARFARKAAVESLGRLERWFGMPHPYPKLDLLALPDFAFGAMENAGAVFFRDSVMLLDEKEASTEEQMRAAETIAHELSHMWFGNLVTMAWWNDLWLNESFATWMAYEIVDDWRPDWRIWHEFIHRRENALEVDALRSSHPIAPPIRTAEEAHENFDAITYTKGASVLRMLERYVGARVFRRGVRLYIKRHREGAATASDLWSALSEAAGLPIEKIIAPWTLQTGYPIVRAECRTTRKGGDAIELRQERFLALPPRRPKRPARPPSSPLWSIPWLGRVGRGGRSKEIRHLLTRARDQTFSTGLTLEWLYANANEAGFFRIDHAGDGFDRLLRALPHLSELERIGWVGHQWALVRTGRARIATVLDLIAALGRNEDPDVLAAAERVLENLLRRLAPECGGETEARLRSWIAVQFGDQFEDLGLDGPPREDPTRRRRRARIVSIVGGLARSDSIVEMCAARTREHLDSTRALPAGVGNEIVRIAAYTPDSSLQAALLRAVLGATTPQSRRRSLFALAGFDRGPGLRRTLRATLDPGLAPAVDRATLLMLLLSSPGAALASWQHLQKAWTQLETQMPPILLARIVAETSNALPPSEAPHIRAFFEQHPLAAGSRVLDQVAEQLAIAGRLRAHAGNDLDLYLGVDG